MDDIEIMPVDSLALGECHDGHMILIINGVGFHFGEREEAALLQGITMRQMAAVEALGGDVDALTRVVSEETLRQINSKKAH